MHDSDYIRTLVLSWSLDVHHLVKEKISVDVYIYIATHVRVPTDVFFFSDCDCFMPKTVLNMKKPNQICWGTNCNFFFLSFFSFLCRRVKEQKTVVLLFRFSVNSIVIICCHLLCLFPLFDRDCCCDLFYKQTNKGNETGFKWLPELTKTETSLTLKVLAYPEQRENPAANCVYLCILWKANPFRVTPRATPLFTLGDFSLGVSVFCCCCCFGWFFVVVCTEITTPHQTWPLNFSNSSAFFLRLFLSY